MELLRSSILGKEFVNYRKTTMKHSRLRFSESVRNQGIGNVPIVIDSVEKDLSELLCEKEAFRRERRYGVEMVFHMDKNLNDVMKEIKILLMKRDKEELLTQNLVLGLEDGVIPQLSTELGQLYKKHRNKDDKILYLLLSRQKTMYGYIMSIIKYLTESIFSFFEAKKVDGGDLKKMNK